MNLSNIPVQGAKLVRVLEDLEQSKLKMVVLFVGDRSKETAGRLLVFDGVAGYGVFEERGAGCPAIVSLSSAEISDGLHRVRLDTSRGYREVHCTAVRDCSDENAV
jgi:hypothetical protein